MKPLERDMMILAQMGSRMLVEHALRLWASQLPDPRPKEQAQAWPYIHWLHDRLAFDVSTGQVAYFYEGGFDLAAFVSWWRLGPETEQHFRDAARQGVCMSNDIPPDNRLVMAKRPAAVFVCALITKPERPHLARALARAVRQANPDSPAFFWWDRRDDALRDWSGNE